MLQKNQEDTTQVPSAQQDFWLHPEWFQDWSTLVAAYPQAHRLTPAAFASSPTLSRTDHNAGNMSSSSASLVWTSPVLVVCHWTPGECENQMQKKTNSCSQHDWKSTQAFFLFSKNTQRKLVEPKKRGKDIIPFRPLKMPHAGDADRSSLPKTSPGPPYILLSKPQQFPC